MFALLCVGVGVDLVLSFFFRLSIVALCVWFVVKRGGARGRQRENVRSGGRSRGGSGAMSAIFFDWASLDRNSEQRKDRQSVLRGVSRPTPSAVVAPQR